MNGLLTRLLGKRGIEDPKDLSQEERQTFETWQAILSKDELTIDDIKEFCRTQITIIEAKWADYALEAEKKANLIPYHTCYRTMLAAIESPRSSREALEKNLNQLLNT